MNAADRRIAAGLFVLSFVSYAWFFGGGGWHQNAQFALTRSLVERGTFILDDHPMNTGDISWSRASGEWHVYSNKPPGLSFLGALPYAMAYGTERLMGVAVDEWQTMTLNAYIVTVMTCGITGAMIPVLLYRYARRRAGASAAVAVFVALTIAFATIVFPYATMLFAHVPAAFFLLLAFVWLDERPLLAGVAAGIAGVSFLFCIPAAAVLCLGALARSRRNAVAVAAGGLPFGVLLALYNYICFGSPLVTSPQASKHFADDTLLLGMFRLPLPEAIWGVTFSAYRGLFYVSPVLLVAAAGAWIMFRQKTMRRELAMIASIFAILLAGNASFNGWEGGNAFGPRYLLVVIPLMGVPLLFARTRLALTVAGILAVVSFSIQLVATAVDPMPPARVRDPIAAYLLPAFLTGSISPEAAVARRLLFTDVGMTSINVQSVDEVEPHHRYAGRTHEATWASFNLGELLFGPGTRSSIVPITLWIVAGSALLVWHARRVDLALQV
ncbi:MAG TPA: hypothetical protein VFT12_00590 [Thermoanaerobaculia bacterium]|nr:hypothetical protein [Thermoanaerobaculia bacterium]